MRISQSDAHTPNKGQNQLISVKMEAFQFREIISKLNQNGAENTETPQERAKSLLESCGTFLRIFFQL